MNRKLKRTVLTAAILAVCLSACASPLREETQENGEAQTMDETQMAAYAEAMKEEYPTRQFCLETLSGGEQVWYRDIYLALSGMEEEYLLHTGFSGEPGEEDIEKVFYAVMNDHPELFFVSGYTYTKYTMADKLLKISFSGTYTMDTYERVLREREIDRAAEECLQALPAEASDYEKVKYVYEYVILHTDYRKDAPDNQNICSCLLSGESVCQGYAKTVQYLLNRAGINSVLVSGTVYGGQAHAFNLVEVERQCYYVDATWGDPSYQSEEKDEGAGSLPQINYDYLCVPAVMLEKTHTVDTLFALPECTSMQANYYVTEGAYFTEYDEEAVEDFFEKAQDAGKTTITFMCSDDAVYDTFVTELVTNQKIFRYFYTAGGRIAYTEDAAGHSLTFWLVNE